MEVKMIIGFVLGLVNLIMGVLVRYVMADIKDIKKKLESCTTRDELKEYVELKDEVRDVQYTQITEDLKEVKDDLKKLISQLR